MIEIRLDEYSDKIQLEDFYLFQNGVSKENSQAPYLEQFLNEEERENIYKVRSDVKYVVLCYEMNNPFQ